MTERTEKRNAFVELEPEALESGIRALVSSYQKTRSALIAWLVVRYAQALCQHPDFEGSDAERCAWRRLANKWRLLAIAPSVLTCGERRATA